MQRDKATCPRSHSHGGLETGCQAKTDFRVHVVLPHSTQLLTNAEGNGYLFKHMVSVIPLKNMPEHTSTLTTASRVVSYSKTGI